MSKRWMDEDVERLVEVVGRATEEAPAYFNLTGPEINQALAPFRPDPEEELIEAMAIVHQNTIATMNPDAIWTWDECNERAKTEVQAGIRAALAVIKEKGYFNDQR